MKQTERLDVRLPKADKQKARNLASRIGIALSDLIRLLIRRAKLDDFLPEEENKGESQ